MGLSNKISEGICKAAKNAVKSVKESEYNEHDEEKDVAIGDENETEQQPAAKTLDDMSVEERMEYICQMDFIKAKKFGWPEPDFDFREHYSVGERIYYVRVLVGEKELQELKIRSIYPRTVVGLNMKEKGVCTCIGYNNRDRIFTSRSAAIQYYDTVIVSKKKENDIDTMVMEHNNEIESEN